MKKSHRDRETQRTEKENGTTGRGDGRERGLAVPGASGRAAPSDGSDRAPQSSNLIAGLGPPRDYSMEDIARHEERG